MKAESWGWIARRYSSNLDWVSSIPCSAKAVKIECSWVYQPHPSPGAYRGVGGQHKTNSTGFFFFLFWSCLVDLLLILTLVFIGFGFLKKEHKVGWIGRWGDLGEVWGNEIHCMEKLLIKRKFQTQRISSVLNNFNHSSHTYFMFSSEDIYPYHSPGVMCIW